MANKIVFVLLILINLLNLFFSRDGSDGDRSIIQACNGLLLVIILFNIFMHWKKNGTKVVYFLIAFIFLLLIYLFAQYIFIYNAFFSLGHYVKWLLAMSLIIYFYQSKDSKTATLLQVYVITYIAQIAKKIFSGHWFQEAIDGGSDLSGGDYMSLGLAMAVPLIFIAFDKKKSPILFFICFALTVFSLRRSSIIAICIAIPFFWSYIKKYFNKKNAVWFSLLLIPCCVFVWNKIGHAVFFRMQELLYVQQNASGASYGSGRSVYWYYLGKSFVESGNWFLGNGLGSVHEHFCKTYLYAHLSHAHSDLVEIFYTFGILGTSVYIGFCYSFFMEIRKLTPMEIKKTGYGIFFIYLFIALTTGVIYRAEFFPMAIAMGMILKKNYSSDSTKK